MNSNKTITIVGAGLGGLTATISLAKNGYEVVLVKIICNLNFIRNVLGFDQSNID